MSFIKLSSAYLNRNQKALILVGLTIVAYYAAFNRPQTFPWVVASLLLSTLVSGFLWPRLLIKNISIERKGPERSEVGADVSLNITITNHGTMPKFMIKSVDRLPFADALNTSSASKEKTLGLIAYLAKNSSYQFSVSIKCEKRGQYKLGPVGLATNFPLGLYEAYVSKNGGLDSLIVYPKVFTILSLPLYGTPSEIHRGGFLLPKGVGSADFLSLREYRQGDNPKYIHWPSTARYAGLMVKEFEPLASANIHLILDSSSAANVGLGRDSTFEYAVEIAASISRYACNMGMAVSVTTDDTFNRTSALGTGEMHFQEILDMLAVIDSNGDSPYSTIIENVAQTIRYGQTAIIFLSIPETSSTLILQAITKLQERGANIIAITFDISSFLDSPQQSASSWSILLDMGVHLISIRKGDDLVRIFNQ